MLPNCQHYYPRSVGTCCCHWGHLRRYIGKGRSTTRAFETESLKIIRTSLDLGSALVPVPISHSCYLQAMFCINGVDPPVLWLLLGLKVKAFWWPLPALMFCKLINPGSLTCSITVSTPDCNRRMSCNVSDGTVLLHSASLNRIGRSSVAGGR